MAPSVDLIPIQNLTLDEKATAGTKKKNTSLSLQKFSSFDSTPSIGTEFRALSNDGKPTLSIRAVLESDENLKALSQLV